MLKILSLIGAKGGTLKTSTVLELGHLFALAGLDVALVDADPQGSLTLRSGMERSKDPLAAEPRSIRFDGMPETAGRILLMPGGRALETADEEMIAAHLERARSLGGDLILVDTPPALGPIVRASLGASDLVLVPCPPGKEGLEGFGDQRATLGSVAPETPIRALIALAHMRSNLLKWTLEQFGEAFPMALYEGAVIPFEMAAAEAGTIGTPVTASAPRSRSAAAYRKLARAVAQDLGLDIHISEEV